MKISPEPNWDAHHSKVCEPDISVEEMLKATLIHCTKYPKEIVLVQNFNGYPLGSFTPEWFLKLPTEDRLRFLAVLIRMYDTEVSDVQTN